MISVPVGTGDMPFRHDIRFAGDMRLPRMIRNGYHIMLPLGGNISYGLGRISYRAAIYHYEICGQIARATVHDLSTGLEAGPPPLRAGEVFLLPVARRAGRLSALQYTTSPTFCSHNRENTGGCKNRLTVVYSSWILFGKEG